VITPDCCSESRKREWPLGFGLCPPIPVLIPSFTVLDKPTVGVAMDAETVAGPSEAAAHIYSSNCVLLFMPFMMVTGRRALHIVSIIKFAGGRLI
jgi:hypothetical protein